MPVRIQLRLGHTLPSTEYLEVGELVFDPDSSAIGIGYGSSQPNWMPGVDRLTQDLVLQPNSLVQGQTGGKNARFGWSGVDQFDILTTPGLQLRIAGSTATFYSRTVFAGGGSLQGNFDTSGGRFTSININEIVISSSTDLVKFTDENSNLIGQLDSYGVTSQAQQDTYAVLAAAFESQASLIRDIYASGLIGVNASLWQAAFDPKYKAFNTSFSALGVHSHPNWQSMCGMDEISVVVNGYAIKTRHYDYQLMRPITDVNFGSRALNSPPPVPAECLALPSGYTGLVINDVLTGSQVAWMQNVYTNNPESCVFELAYLEVWLEKFDGNFNDISQLDGNTTSYKAMQDAAQWYNRNGFTPPNRNYSDPNAVVATYDVNGHPVLAYLNWRVSSVPVGTLSTSDQNLTLDGVGYSLRALPFNATKAAAGIVDSTNRFKLRRDLRTRYLFRTPDFMVTNSPLSSDALQLIQSASTPALTELSESDKSSWLSIAQSGYRALFDCADLEILCKKCPGFGGVDNFSVQYFSDPLNTTIPGSSPGIGITYSAVAPEGLNYYSNAYSFNSFNAIGENASHVGFNDPNLFIAACNFPQNVTGWSYMIPLELILRTPRESWNPFNVVNRAVVTGDGSVGNPYNGWNPYGISYTIPQDSLIQNTPAQVQADTIKTAFVSMGSGIKSMYASGINVFDITGERRRFPIVPNAQQFSEMGNELAWLKQTLKVVLKAVAGGNITGDQIDDFW